MTVRITASPASLSLAKPFKIGYDSDALPTIDSIGSCRFWRDLIITNTGKDTPETKLDTDMKLFLDTADIDDIAALAGSGLIDGVTTNPSLIAKSGRDMVETIAEISGLVDGPVSAEVTATDADTMLAEGRKLAAIAENIAVKVPLTPAGLATCKALADDGVMVNVTLCFSPAQALLAAKAGAAFISPFVGRLDDIGRDGMGLIEDIASIYANFNYSTEVLVASVRGVQHVVDAALIGADVATVPPSVVHAMFKHPLTDKGLDAFLADWASTGQSIL